MRPLTVGSQRPEQIVEGRQARSAASKRIGELVDLGGPSR